MRKALQDNGLQESDAEAPTTVQNGRLPPMGSGTGWNHRLVSRRLPRMNQRTPAFKCHATGQWFAKWGGRNHYFGTERAAAYKKFLASLGEWAEWRELRSSQRLLPPTQAHLVIDLAETFLARKAADSDDVRRYDAKHPGRFRRR